MKRDRDDGRESQYGGKYARGEGGARGRSRGPRTGQRGPRRPPGRGVEYAGYDYSSYSVPELADDEVELKADIVVKREMVGAIIGRGGSTVTRIRSNSGAHVHIREAAMGDNEQVVEIRGTRGQVQVAADEIKEVLLKEDEDCGRDTGVYDISSATIVVNIAPEMVGCLIGKGGQNVKSIRATTGSQVRVDSLQDGDNVQAVNIHGSVEQVIDAFQKVSEILRSFDPKKSRLLKNVGSQGASGADYRRGVGGGAQLPPNNNLVGINLGGGVAGAGAALPAIGDASAAGLAPGVVQPVVSGNAGQQAFIIQTPTGGAAAGPTILVLQPDGTFLPAPVIYQTLPTAQGTMAKPVAANDGTATAGAVAAYASQGIGAPGTATNTRI